MATTDALPADGVFPPLHHVSGARHKVWRVTVERVADGGAARIVTAHGVAGGVEVPHVRDVTAGKNVGRANATTPWEQALLEARARWRGKLDEGYTPAAATATPAPAAGAAAPTQEGAPCATNTDTGTNTSTNTGTNTSTNTGTNTTTALLLPMLAHDFNKRGKDIAYPCFAQRKLDGVRCLVQARPGGGFVLASRTGKPFPHCEHITDALAGLAAAGTAVPVLDGELYSDTLSFQDLTGLVKRVTLTAEDAAAQRGAVFLWVYDAAVPGVPYADRAAALRAFFAAHGAALAPAVRLLPTDACPDRAAVKALHDGYVAAGYEGAILRNAGGLYKTGGRSADLQKYKEFQDGEYKVVGFAEGEGVERGAVLWVCEGPKGRTFQVRPRGTHEERRALFARGADHVGRTLTVRYQELTPDGMPRFPVGIAFRDYE